MTTPEKFRRRQQVEGGFVVALAIVTIGYGVWDSGEESDRQQCVADAFAEVRDNYEARSAISTREFEATREVITSALTAGTREELITAREAYFSSIESIDEDREKNPVPEFPEGKCD